MTNKTNKKTAPERYAPRLANECALFWPGRGAGVLVVMSGMRPELCLHDSQLPDIQIVVAAP